MSSKDVLLFPKSILQDFSVNTQHETEDMDEAAEFIEFGVVSF